MRTYSRPAFRMAIFFLFCTGIAGTSWQKKPLSSTSQSQTDTLPKEKKADMNQTVISGDLDDITDRLREADERMEDQLGQLNMQKMQADLQKALAKLQSRDMKEAMERSLNQVEMQKIQMQAAKIDWEKIQASMQKAHDNLKMLSDDDMEAAQESIERAKEKAGREAEQWNMNSEQIAKAAEKAMKTWEQNKDRYEADIARAAREMEKALKKDMGVKLGDVHQKLNLALEELEGYKLMLQDMEKDGLLKAGAPYDVEYDNGTLIINGKKQPATVTEKYRHFFKTGKMRLKSDGATSGKKVIVV